MKIHTTSPVQIQRIAKELALSLSYTSKERLEGLQKNRALVVAFNGNLGAGKTTFIQGFLSGLGVKDNVTSPTFVLMKTYKLSAGSYKLVYHVDAYRIKSSEEILDLKWEEIIADPKNIVLIEWPEKIQNIIPENAIKINLEYGEKENERTLIIS